MSLKLTIVDCDKTKSEYCALADKKCISYTDTKSR